jgi:hypothetical protein
MNERSHSLKKIRPELPSSKTNAGMSDGERFQNETLRPILKFQNMLFLSVFQNYIRIRKNVFYELKLEKRMAYISNSIQKDSKLQNSLKGMIIGQFTIEEYQEYQENASAMNKRILTMLVKRLQDQIQFFENKETLVH